MNAQQQPIGWIGAGIMGAPMAAHLLRAGHPLFIHTRTRARAAALECVGAVWCESPADAAAAADIVCINVTDTPDVQAVIAGANGVATALRPGGIIIDFSTISPEATSALAAALAPNRIALLDAPVTGGQIGAQNASLTIMVGGDEAAFGRVRPVLARLGKRIVHVGPSGAGQLLKACNQVLCAVNMIGVCEAIVLARRAGVDPAVLVETLQHGAGGSWALAQLGAKINAGDLAPAFMIALMQKDLRIVQEAAGKLGLKLPGMALAQELFAKVESTPGGTALGTQAMITAYEAPGE